MSDGGTDYASLDTPELIPDDNTFGFTSARYINDSLTISTLSIDLQVTHPDMGELTAVLTSPAGTTVELVASSYAAQADFNGNIGWDFAFANGDLYSFYGEDTVGTWTLNVVDAGAGNTGNAGVLDASVLTKTGTANFLWVTMSPCKRPLRCAVRCALNTVGIWS